MLFRSVGLDDEALIKQELEFVSGEDFCLTVAVDLHGCLRAFHFIELPNGGGGQAGGGNSIPSCSNCQDFNVVTSLLINL